ncbi:MAG: DNA topoisomerase VI subunit B, partial [Candidatus Kariarchaeaceae archaeon]
MSEQNSNSNEPSNDTPFSELDSILVDEDQIPVNEITEKIEPEGEDTKPIKAKKSKKALARDSKARTASAAVFFNENRSIAGFGNSMRAVFTAVRELVENSLDAAEKRGVTPVIDISLRRLDKKELIKLMGTSVVKSKDTRLDFIELSCKDNGIGVDRDLIPQLFGTVLAGTKYGAQQTRGRFGLGSKMVLLYAMSTLDLPIQITTRPYGSAKTHRLKLFIDLEKNAPIIVSDEVFEDGHEEFFADSGTEIKVSFTGSWNLAKLYVREYFRQLAIITPYADTRVRLPGDEAGTVDSIFFQRVVDDIPKPPEVVRVHPWGTDISGFRREISNATEDDLISFLVNNFMGVNPASAEAFFLEVGVDHTKNPKDLTSPEIRRIVHDGFNRALRESKTKSRKRDRVFKFDDPKGDALSPLGANRLRKGLEKELNPDFVEALTRLPRAYEGHPFVIEAAIGYGGGVAAAAASKGVTVVDNRVIYRFANRIPLIFGAGSDLITNVANSMNWSKYGLTRGTEPLAIAVSLVSTKIPFPETSKEYIDKVEEIGAEVKLTLEQLGRKLKTYLGRTRRRQRERQRKSRFERYAPQTVRNLLTILERESKWNPSTGVSPSRIITALSSGTPRIDSTTIPPGDPVYQAPIWSRIATQEKLQDHNIYEISSFLKTPNGKLSTFIGISENKIDEIKRRTINELDLSGEVPSLDPGVILDPDVEKRFQASEFPRLSKAFSRRWIRNSYDYLVSPPDKLAMVHVLATKLVEQERFNVIKLLFESVSEVDLLNELSNFLGSGSFGEIDISTTDQAPITVFFDEEPSMILEKLDASPSEVKEGVTAEMDKKEKLTIKLTDLLPPLEDVYKFETIKKRKISSILEFLLETTHPSDPIDEKVLANILIPHFKFELTHMVAANPALGAIRVDISSQDWIDGYLRNAFKHRKISTISDLINTKDEALIEITVLQRALYSALLDIVIPVSGQIQLSDYKTQNADKKVKILESAKITTLEELSSTSSKEIVDNPKLWKYVELLFEETKESLIEHLTIQNKLGSLWLLKEINRELEEDLFRLEISSTIDLLIKPLDEFSKKNHSRIIEAKSRIGRNFSGFLNKHQDAFKTVGIGILEEFVFNPDYYLAKAKTETVTEDLRDALDYLLLPVTLVSPNLLTDVNLLRDAGVTTVGKFLVWPSKELSRITDMSEEWLDLIRESFSIEDLKTSQKTDLPPLSTISHLIPDEYIKHLSTIGIETIPQAAQIRWGEIFPTHNEKWKTIFETNNQLTRPINLLSDIVIDKKKKGTLSTIFNELSAEDIHTIIQLVKLPVSSVVKKIRGIRKRDVLDEFLTGLYNGNPKISNQESDIYKAILTYRALEGIKSPIVYLSEFGNRDIELLNAAGIETLNQLYCYNVKEVAKILGKPKKTVTTMLQSSELKSKGTSLAIIDQRNNYQPIIKFEKDGIKYFDAEELNNLISNGYETIESLYYMADHRTFEVAGLNWEVINHFKKLLRSPPVLITWMRIIKEEIKEERTAQLSEDDLFEAEADTKKEEKEKPEEKEPEYRDVEYYETFTSKELDTLTKADITRVIDFITYPTKDLSKLLGWDNKQTKDRQTTIILQEAGIGLADLDIFRQAHLDLLNEIGLVTIEDLYFTANEEGWDSQILPWEPISTIKRIIQLHLSNAVEELGEDMVDILVEHGVITILDLLLTGDPILEQKTGLPAERFENLKHALDFGELIQSFDKSVLFTPELNFFQIQKLTNAGYTRILDIVLADHDQIAKVLEVPAPYVSTLLEHISRSSIQKTEDDRGILIKDINAFSRSDQRSIGRSGIFEMNTLDTLQEVMYQITPDIFQGEEYLMKSVLDLQKVCMIKLDQIGDLSPSEIELLKNHRVDTIGDALMIGYEDLETNFQLHTALSNITNSIIDLRPFLALGKLPTHSVCQTGEDETPIIDTWLSDGKMLHQRTMANIRSLLSIPVRLTSFANNYLGTLDELAESTVADILLEYTPDDEHPKSKLKESLKSSGSIIKLLKEGSTAITLLDIDPIAYRSLVSNGINTIERIMLSDEKYLATITKTTQRYWKTIKEVFSPEVFNARMGDIGVPLSTLKLEQKDLNLLSEMGIEYLDQITVFDDEEGIIHDINNYLAGSSIFLTGSPGEREIAINLGAQSVVETILALRKHNADTMTITETISMGWKAFLDSKINLPTKIRKQCLQKGITSMQDLVSHINYSPKGSVSKQWLTVATPFMESPLLLPIPAHEIKEIVEVHRCSNIIEALTSPMIMGKITPIKSEVKSKGKIQTNEDIKLPISVVKKISSQTYRRIEQSDFYLQEFLSSPRTLDEYRGLRQRALSEVRQCLNIPLSRIHINGIPLLHYFSFSTQYFRLRDLIFDLSSLEQTRPEIIPTLTEIFNSDHFKTESDPAIPIEIQKSAETALGITIQGFHDLWIASWTSANIFMKIDTKPAEAIRNYIVNASSSIATIKDITPAERWKLITTQIFTLSDLILTPEPFLVLKGDFTKKRVNELQKLALGYLTQEVHDSSVSIQTIGRLISQITTELPNIPILAAFQRYPHPILGDRLIPESVKQVFYKPFISTGVASSLTLPELKSILQLGVYSIGDFLLYPEELNKMPRLLNTIEQRAVAISESFDSERPDILVSELNLPAVLRDQLGTRTMLSELISYVLSQNNPAVNKVMYFQLRYAGLSEVHVSKLRSKGIETIFDFLIVSPHELSSILNENVDWVTGFIQQLDFDMMNTELTSSQFQIDVIENISSATKSKLSLKNIFTLLDLGNAPPVGLSRSDENLLTSFIQIINAPPSILNSFDKVSNENMQVFREYDSLRTMILNKSTFKKKEATILANLTHEDLLTIKSSQRKLSQLEIISAPEESLLLKNGVFEISQLAKVSIEDLTKLGINKERSQNIIEMLNLP